MKKNEKKQKRKNKKKKEKEKNLFSDPLQKEGDSPHPNLFRLRSKEKRDSIGALLFLHALPSEEEHSLEENRQQKGFSPQY